MSSVVRMPSVSAVWLNVTLVKGTAGLSEKRFVTQLLGAVNCIAVNSVMTIACQLCRFYSVCGLVSLSMVH
jgi:hypothetical protein